MKVADGETEASVCLKSSVGCDHYDARWLEGVLFWEDQLPMIVAT